MFIIGIPIGLYGYLMPGNINLMVLKLYNEKRINLLIMIITLIVLFESFYCFATLYFIQSLFINQQFFSYIQISAIALTFVLGIWMLLEKKESKKSSKHSIQRGLLSIIIHPQQITFWFFITIIFPNAFIQIIGNNDLPLFVLFNAIGTLIIILTYAFIGSKLINMLKLNMNTINKIIGVIYLISGVNSILIF